VARSAKKKLCFVVGPIGDDDSDDRNHADWLLEEIILPVFGQSFTEFDVKRADKISDPGRIDAQVITALLEAELVIADLTTLNPNAFYEIGIRHTVQKPIIHMHLEGQRIPFDIASFRSIKFQRKWPRDLKRAREALKEAVAIAIDPDHKIDNPVTFSRGKFEIAQNASPTDQVLLQEVDLIANRLERLEFAIAGTTPRSSRHEQPMQKFRVKSKNTAPDKDVQTAIRPFLKDVVGVELSPIGRNEANLFVIDDHVSKGIIAWLRDRIGEDFTIEHVANVFS